MKNVVSNVVANGSTNQAIGLRLGWMSLVPFTAPAVHSNYRYDQIIILLSDGLNTQGPWYGDGSNPSGQVDPRQQILCKPGARAGASGVTGPDVYDDPTFAFYGPTPGTHFPHICRVICWNRGTKLNTTGFTDRFLALSGCWIPDQRLLTHIIAASLTTATALGLVAGLLCLFDGSSSQRPAADLTSAVPKQTDGSSESPNRVVRAPEPQPQGSAAVSAETSGVLFFDGPFARWNAIAQYEQRPADRSSPPESAGLEAERAPDGPGEQSLASVGVPLPRNRPALSEPERVQAADTSVSSMRPPEKPLGFFEKLLALARPEPPPPPEATGKTAVYDISARTLFMPSGERLEAHSGLGRFLDDPGRVNEKAKGPTPPNAYRLSLRESPFHGVQAIRLTPLDDGKMYGRAGILAHPYMLGPDGSSNGCVSIQNYPRFLEAFQKGEIERLVVVSGVKSIAPALQAHRGTGDRKVAAF